MAQHTADTDPTAVSDAPRSVASADAGSIRRMYCVDTSNNPRLPILMEMVGSVSRARDPQEIYIRFRRGIRQLASHNAYLALSVRGLRTGEYKITRFERSDGDGEPPTINPWKQWTELPVRRGGFLGELIRSAWPELIYHLDVRDDPAVGDMLAPYGSMMAVPIFDDGEPLNWAIMLGDEPEQFSIDDLEQSVLQANVIGGMTKTKVVAAQLQKAQARISHEVERIAAIQRALLPDPLPTIDGLEIAASYVTSEHAGGDYYDFFPLDFIGDGIEPDPAGRWGIMLADASGHGPSAAVVMAMLHAILHAFAERDHSPATILEHANRQLCAKRIESSFVTAIYGIYDARKHTFEYARAGHPPPLVKSGDQLERLDHVGDVPLGVLTDVALENHTIQLAPGQTVIFYTDGITEAMNEDSDLFGVAGIEHALGACSGAPQCTIDAINAALALHQGDQPPGDDQTIVALRVT